MFSAGSASVNTLAAEGGGTVRPACGAGARAGVGAGARAGRDRVFSCPLPWLQSKSGDRARLG